MSRTLDIELAGETLRLDADRALFWPRRGTLIVADVHLGKGSAFRRAGVAVPSGSTQRDLDRFATLIERHHASRLLVLGDLFHAALRADEPWFAAFDAFRLRHPDLHVDVVRGNHDRIAGVPGHWGLQWHEHALVEPPFVFTHDAGASSQGYALGGHVHPVIRLRSRSDRLRLPVFWLRPAHGVLPSFGSFTGGYEVQPAAGDRTIVASADGLVAWGRA